MKADCGCTLDTAGVLTLCVRHEGPTSASVMLSTAQRAGAEEPMHRCLRSSLLGMHLGASYAMLAMIDRAIDGGDMIEARRLSATGRYEILQLIQELTRDG